MDPEQLNEHLSQISTRWALLDQAHQGSAEAASAAQRQLIQRYTPAIYRYLRGAVRDPEVADELFQEFALRFVRGDFKRADPERGRFRNFLKTSLYHLVVDYQRRRQQQALPLPPDDASPAAGPESTDAGQEFLDVWRAELMGRAWEGLERVERQTGQPLYTVLRSRMDHPGMRSPQMAEELSRRLGKPVTAEWVRKRLFYARQQFTDFLLAEVARSLGQPTREELEQELVDLGLLEYCRPALERRRGGC
jgi:RNA polymerase sigma-70 factor (ECF subfamily)